MCRVSVVIPVLNEEDAIGGQLSRLREDFPAAELIVVDGGSSDRTVDRALGHADAVMLGERGRARQMNLGARAAAGDYLLFLHADTHPGFGTPALQQLFSSRPRWGFFRVRLSGRQAALRVVERAMNLRSRLTGVATGDQCIFAEAAFFREVGGYPEIPLMEDVALSKRLRRRAAPLVARLTVVTSSRRWERHGILRTVLLMWRLRLLYVCGVSPQRLRDRYYGA